MKTKTIGIVGGAGPIAGLALCQRLFERLQRVYGCKKDADFPRVILISYPFSEMLSLEIDSEKIQRELNQCLDQLRTNGADVLAIACNTLHAFVGNNTSDLVLLPQVTAEAIPENELPLVLCTTTSRNSQIHKTFFPCVYPDEQTQQRVDQLIDQILRGIDQEEAVQKLGQIVNGLTESTIILGCTELSQISEQLVVCNRLIIDPLDLVARKLLEIIFNKTGGFYV